MLFSIIKWSDIIVHFNILYSKTELKTNLKKMGQISAKCGVVTHLPNLVSPKVVLRLSDRALILFLSFCKLSEVLKYIYMSNKNRERSRRY